MSETIRVHGEGENYEEALGNAMASLKGYIPEDSQVLRDKPLVRAYGDTSDDDWYLQSSYAEPSPGGQKVAGVFDFERVGEL